MTATRDELLPFVGPAATLPFWAFMARFPYRVAIGLWTTILVCSYLLILVCALRLARAPRDPLLYAGVAGVAIAAAPMIGNLALGQSAIVSAAAVATAIVSYRARWTSGALLGTLLSAVQPNLALSLLGRMRSGWDLRVAVAATAGFAGMTLAAGGGTAGLVAYVQRLQTHGDAERFITIQHTPAAIAYAFGASPHAATALANAVAIVTIIVTIAAIARERLDATTATLLCCAALPLVIPFFHEHDFIIEILPLLMLAIRARGRARALASVAAVLLLVDWFGFAQRHLAQGQIFCLGLVVAFGFIGLTPSGARRRPALAGLGSLIMLASIAIPLAIAHPAPTWPDALPTTYQAAASADASQVWADEQRASGLATIDPVWGALRSLPLIGCVVLGFALVANVRDAKRRKRTRRAGSTIGWVQPPIPV